MSPDQITPRATAACYCQPHMKWNRAWIAVALMAVAHCGGRVVYEQGPAVQPAPKAPQAMPDAAPAPSAEIDRARAKCPADSDAGLLTGLSQATHEQVQSRLPGQWVRCARSKYPQFGETDGISISGGKICPLAVDASGRLAADGAKPCWSYAATSGGSVVLYRSGASGDGVNTAPWFNADESVVSICADPYCGLYARVE
jgi:hypothetical protein